MENRFDIQELPQGHAERFEAKLDARLARIRRRRRVVRWTAAAAGLAAVLWLGTRMNTSLWMVRTPEAVYSAYLNQVGELYRLMAVNTRDGSLDLETILQELTDEAVPLYDQLPEELSDREKTTVLKQHYGSILTEARRLKTIDKQ